VGTNSEVYNGILLLFWRWMRASVPCFLSHLLYECKLFVSADVPQGRSWVQKQKFAVVVSVRAIQQEHVKRGIAVVVRRSIIPWYIKAWYNTVGHEQVQVHQISHLYGHYKRTRCQSSITQMQLFTRQYIEGQFYNKAMVNIPRMRRERNFILVKGNQQCGFR
jgi:hypothetical protein